MSRARRDRDLRVNDPGASEPDTAGSDLTTIAPARETPGAGPRAGLNIDRHLIFGFC